MEQEQNNYIIRPIKKNDSKRIWQIRNHPLAREHSNNPEPISFKNHQKWFEKKYFSKEKNFCFVLERQSKAIGYCRFDLGKESNFYIISLALDVNEQGRGLGNFLLSYSLKKIKISQPILAEVRIGNMPGLKVFQKNNFKVLRQDQEKYYLQHQNARYA